LSWSAVPRPMAKTRLLTDDAAAAIVLSAVSWPSVKTIVAEWS
jgi:hypothetical protein